VRVSLSCLAIALTLCLVGCSTSDQKVVFSVGSQRLTEAEFNTFAESAQSQYPGDPEAAKGALLNDLMSARLMLELAHRLGQDTTAALGNLIREEEERALVQMMVARDASPQQRVSEAEAMAFFAARNTESHVHLIFCTTREAAQGAVTRLARGESFEVVATQMNLAGLLPSDGDMGMVAAGSLPSPLDEAVRTLPVGVVGGPYEGSEGFFVMRISERRPREQGTWEANRDGMYDLARQRKQRAAFQRMYSTLKQAYQYTPNEEGAALLFRLTLPADPMTPTAAQLAMPLATYRDSGVTHTYTMQDAFNDLHDANVQRPPSQSQPAVAIWIEKQVMTDVIVREARHRHYHEDPAVVARLTNRREQLLLDGVRQWALAAVPTPSAESVDALWMQMRERFAQVVAVRLAVVTVPDSTTALKLQEAMHANASLAAAAQAVDPALTAEMITVANPAQDPEWGSMAGMFQQMQVGAAAGPEPAVGGWRAIQLLDKQVVTPTFQQLPAEMQQNFVNAAAEAASEQRFMFLSDSLGKAYQPFVNQDLVRRLRWPGAPKAPAAR